MPSASSKTFCSTSLTCFSSFEMVTTPTTDLCHVSWCSSSATATLKSLLSLSFRLRNTCRLSFNDCASGMCSSRVSKPTGFCGAHFGDVEAFQNVANLDVIEVGHARTAFETRAHFAGVVFEPLQRTQLRRVNNCSVANHANLRFALQNSIDDVAARHRACAFYLERVPHFRTAQIGLCNDRLEQTFHSLLNFVRNFVNDVVRPNVHVLLLRQVRCLAVRAHAESDDDRA